MIYHVNHVVVVYKNHVGSMTWPLPLLLVVVILLLGMNDSIQSQTQIQARINVVENFSFHRKTCRKTFGCQKYHENYYQHHPSLILSFVSRPSPLKNIYSKQRQRGGSFQNHDEVNKKMKHSGGSSIFHTNLDINEKKQSKQVGSIFTICATSSNDSNDHYSDTMDQEWLYTVKDVNKNKDCMKSMNMNSIMDMQTTRTRREMIFQSDAIFKTMLLGTSIISSNPSKAYGSTTRSTRTTTTTSTITRNNNSTNINQETTMDPIDIQKVLEQNKINITLTNTKLQSQIYINQTSLDKMSVPAPPYDKKNDKQSKALPLSSWVTQNINYQFRQRFFSYPKTVEKIPDYKVFIATAIAGSVTEVIRTVVLYPITTIKSRVQYDPRPTVSIRMKLLSIMNLHGFKKIGKSSTSSSIIGQLDKESYLSEGDGEERDETDSSSSSGISWNQEKDVVISPNIYYNSTAMIGHTKDINNTTISSKTSTIILPEQHQQHQQEKLTTNLYAGIIPQLIAAVPACGIYFAVRDITKRELTTIMTADADTSSSLLPLSSYITSMDDLSLTLFSVFLGDVFSLAIKTPALTLSTRKQVESAFIDNAGNDHTNSTLSSGTLSTSTPSTMDIFQDSWKQLPIVILTDLPYLFLKIIALRLLATGQENMAEYTLLNVVLSCFCAAITTPFDVVRTRILVDSNGDPSDGLDGGFIHMKSSEVDEGYTERSGSLESIIYTMQVVMNETNKNDFVSQDVMDDTDGSVYYQEEDILLCQNEENEDKYIRVQDNAENKRNGAAATTTTTTTTTSVDTKQHTNAGIQNLFAGWYERALYLGLSVAWFDSLRILSYVGIRDFLLLQVLQ